MRTLLICDKTFVPKQLEESVRKLPYGDFDQESCLDFETEASVQKGIETVMSDAGHGLYFDLIIVSHTINPHSGTQFSHSLSQTRALPPLPLILIVNNPDKKIVAEIAAGFTYIIKSPVTSDALKERLSAFSEKFETRILERRKLEKEMLTMTGKEGMADALAHLNSGTIQALKKALFIAPWHVGLSMNLVNLHRENHDFKSAISLLKPMIQNDFSNKEAHKALSECYKQTGQSIVDLETLMLLLKDDPESSELLYKIATAYMQNAFSRDRARAIEYYKKAIAAHKPEDPAKIKAESYVGLGKIYLAQGEETNDREKYRDALRALKKAVDAAPDLNSAYFQLIIGRKKLGIEKEAAALLEKISKIKPETASDWLEWFFYYLFKDEGGQRGKAGAALAKALEPDPENQITLCLAGEAYFRQKMFGDAMGLFKKAVEANPSDTRLYNWLGICCRNTKECSNAIVCYRKALEIDPEDFNVHFNLGRVYEMEKDFAQAREAYENALKYNPDLLESKRALGRLPNA